MDLTDPVTLPSSSWSEMSLDSVVSLAKFLLASLSSIGFSGFELYVSAIVDGLISGSELSLLAVTAVIGVYSGFIVTASSVPRISKLSSVALISGSLLNSLFLLYKFYCVLSSYGFKFSSSVLSGGGFVGYEALSCYIMSSYCCLALAPLIWCGFY